MRKHKLVKFVTMINCTLCPYITLEYVFLNAETDFFFDVAPFIKIFVTAPFFNEEPPQPSSLIFIISDNKHTGEMISWDVI